MESNDIPIVSADKLGLIAAAKLVGQARLLVIQERKGTIDRHRSLLNVLSEILGCLVNLLQRLGRAQECQELCSEAIDSFATKGGEVR